MTADELIAVLERVADLRTALDKVANHEDHDKYCDACRCREAIALDALEADDAAAKEIT